MKPNQTNQSQSDIAVRLAIMNPGSFTTSQNPKKNEFLNTIDYEHELDY